VLYSVLERFEATCVSAVSGRVLSLQALRETGLTARLVALALGERHAAIWKLRCSARAEIAIAAQAAAGVPPSERRRPIDLVTRYLEAMQGAVRDFSVCLGSGASRADAYIGGARGASSDEYADGDAQRFGVRDDMTVGSVASSGRRGSIDRSALAAGLQWTGSGSAQGQRGISVMAQHGSPTITGRVRSGSIAGTSAGGPAMTATSSKTSINASRDSQTSLADDSGALNRWRLEQMHGVVFVPVD